MPADELKIVKDYRNLLAESIFFHALNQRFFKISRRKDSAYFSAADVVARPVKAYIMTSFCKEKGTIIEALKSILTEVARVPLHGFSECENSVAQALLMSEIESAYLERKLLELLLVVGDQERIPYAMNNNCRETLVHSLTTLVWFRYFLW
ncbi:Zinc protease PQQL-like [Camellia lanceoleosa]|uniref:Zinc protease PQQL-like n=1 Tax=Camellia lanceoleosa TaxID=1840588 RepID=A0ACC0HIX2_9ERIC|nr:Zinc protease PQQL-like [Camellia lanceoleosa]